MSTDLHSASFAFDRVSNSSPFGMFLTFLLFAIPIAIGCAVVWTAARAIVHTVVRWAAEARPRPGA